MSTQLSPEVVLFRQRLLACAEYYSASLDGRWGPKTEAADQAFHAEYLRQQTLGGTFDPRSEAAIATLLPRAQAAARTFLRIAGPACKLLSGTRTYAEQDALYAKRPKVTNARGGQSNHNFGIAWDVGIFQNGHYLAGDTHVEELAYATLAAKIKLNMQGIEWGGDWHSFVDAPHYQLATGKSLAKIRSDFEAGRPFI